MINVCCVYYGNKYDTKYVDVLYNMVQRHLTVPYKFYCFTDHVNLQDIIKKDIIFKKFPRFDMEGWWNKLQLFHPETGLEGVNLYFDLDVCILKNIDCFANYGNTDSFSILKDFGQPTTIYNSSIMKWNNNNATAYIWEPYFSDRTHYRKHQGDQNVITDLIQNKKELLPFPDEWTQSYKWFSRTKPRFSKNEWTFELNEQTIVAVFHGKPDPHESTQEWVKNNWK